MITEFSKSGNLVSPQHPPAASVLGISPAQMCKLEGNQKTLRRNDLDRYLEKLAEAGRRARWDG